MHSSATVVAALFVRAFPFPLPPPRVLIDFRESPIEPLSPAAAPFVDCRRNSTAEGPASAAALSGRAAPGTSSCIDGERLPLATGTGTVTATLSLAAAEAALKWLRSPDADTSRVSK